LAVLLSASGTFAGNKRSKEKGAKGGADDVTPEELLHAQTVEARVRELIGPTFGERLREVDAIYPGHGAIRVSFLARAKGPLAVAETKIEMRDTYHSIFASDLTGIEDVMLFAYAPVMDGLGNSTMQIVYATRLRKTVAAMINWKNKESLDFTKLWETQTQESSWTEGP
jgi:hypothetical protein